MTAVTSTQPAGDGRHARQVGAEPPRVPAIPLSPEPPVSYQDQSIGMLVREASAQLSTLIRSEVELARAEVASEVRKGVRGSVFFLIALAIVLFSVVFPFLALVEVLDTWWWRWASFVAVFAVMLVTAGLFVLLGYRRVRSIHKPERTISSLQEAVQLTRRNGDGAGHHDG